MVATIFSVALAIGFVIVLVLSLRGKTILHVRSWLAGIVLGLINFGSTYLLLKSMEFYTSSTLFPIRNTGVVGLSALAGLLLFGERLTRKNWLGIILAIVSIVLITSG
jgi:drug/metabolite transporter (DMT)-like permease